MTDIEYTYEIISVDEAARCMEIVYTSEKYGVAHIGARLPFEGEHLEDVVIMFAPVAEWRFRDMPVVVPFVGLTGQLVDGPKPEPVIDPEIAAREKRNELLRGNVDPYVMNSLRWADLSEDHRQQIADYRRALLDITDQPGFPLEITWPVPPSFIA
jgi:hypothetical protein